MITRLPFGKTGHQSTRTLFGAAALYHATQEEADQVMEMLLAYGVNHIDTAAGYGDAEIRLGSWMDYHRGQFFLASKTDQRTYWKAREQIHRSLSCLRTEYLDLMHLHGVTDETELDTVTGAEGALKAIIEARQRGLIRTIGISSHGLQAPVIHLTALQRFDFDTVMLPFNFMLMQNCAYAANFLELMKVCQEKNVAVQLIKTVQRRLWEDRPPFADTWYEPFNDQSSIDLAVHYALGQSGVFLNTPGDVRILPMVLDAASRFEKIPCEAKMQAMVLQQSAKAVWPRPKKVTAPFTHLSRPDIAIY
jgi:predicted aldo/keto reductase-like oxidoreductase